MNPVKASISVFSSDITINGESLIVRLGITSSKINTGTVLLSNEGLKWRIIENDLQFQREITKIVKEKER
jgi:hypothetical protein